MEIDKNSLFLESFPFFFVTFLIFLSERAEKRKWFLCRTNFSVAERTRSLTFRIDFLKRKELIVFLTYNIHTWWSATKGILRK